MLFGKKIKPGDYEVSKEGEEDVMYINYENVNLSPSLEGSAVCMSDTVEKILQSLNVSRIIFYQKKNYEYDQEQTKMLKEIAIVYNHLVKQKRILLESSNITDYGNYSGRQALIQDIVLNLLKSDPIGAYVELKRLIREERINLEKAENKEVMENTKRYLGLLLYVYNLIDNTKLVGLVKPFLAGHVIGERAIYRTVFKPNITPDFMLTRLMAEPPLTAREIDAYNIDDDTNVMLFNLKDDIKTLYHLSPPEFKLTEDQYMLLDLARSVLSEHQPKAEEFVNIERMRETFFNIGRDLINELAENKGIDLKYDEIENLARILVRYTVGFGLLEILLKDIKIQDVVINGPIGETPIFIVHQDYGECVTNIIPSRDDGLGWATKFRIISGRPLDEANPVLDTELIIPGARARVAIVGSPLNPHGLGYAFRRHRDKPWTLSLYIKNKMISDLGAGLISFLIDGSRSLLIAGTRSSGKTSLLGSCLIEIMRKYRIITVEDTLELPTDYLRKLGYNIQPLKVRAALAVAGGTEFAADEGIRTSLRMGDSSLIIGEVRSKEALALYEAMRVGALANVVAGTIHGDSPYGVFDRVVNDLGVPKTSFKATDIIVVANPIKTADGLHSKRRIVSITEVRKEWDDDPLKEGAFVDLMRYNSKTDMLEPTDNLINGDSEIIKNIAANVKEWAGNWDAVWENILLRAKIKKQLVDVADKSKLDILLEADFTVKANDEFHKISDEIRQKKGYLDSKQIFFDWNEWLKKEVKKIKTVK